MPEYPPGGTLFVNDRKEKDSHPDYNGYLEIDADTLRSLNEQDRAGETPKMDLSGWKKTARATGKSFLSLSAKPPWKKDGGRSGGGGGGGSRDSGRDSGRGSSSGRSQRSFDDAPF